MRHRVFEDDEDYEIDKYDIQVCVFIIFTYMYEHNYGISFSSPDIAFFNIKNSVKNGDFSVRNYLDLGLARETTVI